MSPRLPTTTPRVTARALERAGFSYHHTRGSHRYYFHTDNKRMVAVPFHPGDIKRGTLRAIIRQAGLTVQEFMDFC